MRKSTKILAVIAIIVIIMLCLTACNSAEETADVDKTFDERVIEAALDELDKTSKRKELVFLFGDGESSEYLLITDDGVYLIGTDSECNVDVEKQLL
ncbi:MAG TPA: hypothetical protein DE061_01645 [Clostridiales bacterium]|nr:hypothetical protein [Clostridiales bacterium]